MRAWRWTGETYAPCDSLPISDRGFRYGMSLFETIRIWRSRPLFFKEHLARLHDGCRQRQFTPDSRALSAAEAVLAGERDGVARLYVTAGDGPLSEMGSSQPRIFILAEERSARAVDAFRLTVHREMHRAAFGGLKTANYWANADALQMALRAGFDETLLLNEKSILISAATANVFVVRGSLISTPGLDYGARDGVTRAWVIGQTRAAQAALSIADLHHADEIFLTNSWHGVLPVATLDDRSLPTQGVGLRLACAFQEAIED